MASSFDILWNSPLSLGDAKMAAERQRESYASDLALVGSGRNW